MHTAMVSKFDRNTRRLAVRGKAVTATRNPIMERGPKSRRRLYQYGGENDFICKDTLNGFVTLQ